MTCIELFDYLKSGADSAIIAQLFNDNGFLRTCDSFKAGNQYHELQKVAVSMFATINVIKEALEFGADLLIVHEPIYYNHWDNPISNKVGQLKQKLIEQSGLTIFRLHDYAHSYTPDLIFTGEMSLLGLKGQITERSFAHTSFALDVPMTALEIARVAEKKLNTKHIRIAGCKDKPGTRLSCSFGFAGNVAEEIEKNDFYICGEITEWCDGELVRDYAQLGYNKALIVLTHEVSERAGMQLLTNKLKVVFPEIEFRYIESGSLYSYTN